MKKIIIGIDNFRIGGAERVASLIANELSKNHEVHAIIFESEIRYTINPKVNLHIIKYNGRSRIIKILERLAAYRSVIKGVNPDAIYAFAYVSIYAAIAKVLAQNTFSKLICSERTDPSREPTSKITRRLRDWAYSKSDILVCQTPDVVEYFKSKGLAAEYTVIPNPVKSNLPDWTGEKSRIFITACRLAPQKNLPLLLNSFKRMKERCTEGYKLEIYGEGPEKETLEEMVENLGLNNDVCFKPFAVDIHDVMRRSLAYVSSSDYEGISNSMLESLAIGMPTICTDCPVGGAKMFIVNKKNGLLVPVDDEESLADAMEKVAAHQIDLEQISKEAKKIRELISTDKIVSQWLNLLK